MTRWFNIAGPCYADEHYMIPPERRVGEALTLIGQGHWFMLVSGRQTGKTTVAQWIAAHLNTRGQHLALWVDIEGAREQLDVVRAMPVMLHALDRAVTRDAPTLARPTPHEIEAMLRVPESALQDYLSALSRVAATPLVLLLDEADTLVGAAMVSFLTQLRALYLDRKRSPAPWCVVLAGVRAVRDYALDANDHRAVKWLGTESPFNITVENVGLAPFTEAEVDELLGQHTVETGQRFEPEAVARVHELTAGHPWLVNALADQCARRDVPERDMAITAAHVEDAKEMLILERRTHIDSLAARLREERVRRILDPMIAGGRTTDDALDDDFAYVAGLGLVRYHNRRYEIANPIYREVILRALTHRAQTQIEHETARYVGADGLLDAPKLMGAWQTFWRKDGHLAADGFSYKESGPHLMLMTFLQRIVNGGGRIEREYALGKGALDLLVEWKTQRLAIEVKLRRDTETEDEALAQVARYLDSLGLTEAWLVMFDLRSTAPWSERLFVRDKAVGARTVHVVGC